MNASDIRVLYEYNDWANALLFSSIAQLPQEKIDRDLGGSLPSLRNVVAHIMTAEWAWLERLHGVSPTSRPDWADENMSTLQARLGDIESKRTIYVEGLTDAHLSEPLTFTYLSGKSGVNVLQDVLVHVVNHSTYHRGQITLMFRQLDEAPPSTDFIAFRSLQS